MIWFILWAGFGAALMYLYLKIWRAMIISSWGRAIAKEVIKWMPKEEQREQREQSKGTGKVVVIKDYQLAKDLERRAGEERKKNELPHPVKK